jgi:predicted membrane protein
MVCLKIPNCTHIVCVVLIVVVLIAIIEILFPCVVSVVLTGTPIVVRSNTLHKGVGINTRLLIFIAALFKTFNFFSV